MMHILNKTEEAELLKTPLILAQEKALLFCKENNISGLDNKDYRDLTRLFLLANQYNTEMQIPIFEIKNALEKKVGLSQIVQEFRKNIKIYEQDIRDIISKGLYIRKAKRPEYPSFFKDKERIYLKIEPVSSSLLFVQNILNEINDALPEDEHLRAVVHQGNFLVQTKRDQNVKTHVCGTRAGHFFKRQSVLLSELIRFFTIHQNEIDEKSFFLFFNNLKKYANFQRDYLDFRCHGRTIFARGCLSMPLFYALKSMGKISKTDEMVAKLNELRNFYSKAFSNLQKMQTAYKVKKQDDEVIDLLIISKSAKDIAAMSAYAEYSKNEWGSCLLPTGINAHYLPKEIGNGVFVVYGVNSKNPLKRLSRISVKPYLNDKGEVYYGAGYMYGIMMPQVEEQLQAFLSDYQPELKGCFTLHQDVYHDAVTDKYYFQMTAEDILKDQCMPFYTDASGNISVGNSEVARFERAQGLEMLLQLIMRNGYSKKVVVDLDGIDEGVDFSKMDMHLQFECFHLKKSKAHILPKHADEMFLLSPNLRDFQGINKSFFSLSVTLTSSIKSLNGLTKNCSSVEFSRVKINTPVFKVPNFLKSFVSSVVTYTMDELDLSDCRGTVEFHESDLSAVKSFNFPKNADSLVIFGTKLPAKISGDFKGISSLTLCPLGYTEIKNFQISDKMKKIFICNAIFKSEEIDLSLCKNITLDYASFKSVKKLKLPSDFNGKLISCKFPKGLTEEEVIKNNGFDLTKSPTRICQKANPHDYVGLSQQDLKSRE